ncbi:hypothetical protein ACKS0A_06374 [Histoplasma ohiense]
MYLQPGLYDCSLVHSTEFPVFSSVGVRGSTDNDITWPSSEGDVGAVLVNLPSRTLVLGALSPVLPLAGYFIFPVDAV